MRDSFGAIRAVLVAAVGLAALGALEEMGGPVLASSEEDERVKALERLLGSLETFEVTGKVATDDGILLPEIITVEIKSEVCVESRAPGTRFWSLEYDTCVVYAALDSVDAEGTYQASVPCLDADKSYESRHGFGDLRLVQRGPVSFLAESDAGWRHQETFASSRSQRRDLVLTLDTDTFWVVTEEAPMWSRPEEESEVLRIYAFGAGLEVVRFRGGWAECLMEHRLGWVEMRNLGTEEEMKLKAPLRGTPALRPKRTPPPEGEDGP